MNNSLIMKRVNFFNTGLRKIKIKENIPVFYMYPESGYLIKSLHVSPEADIISFNYFAGIVGPGPWCGKKLRMAEDVWLDIYIFGD